MVSRDCGDVNNAYLRMTQWKVLACNLIRENGAS